MKKKVNRNSPIYDLLPWGENEVKLFLSHKETDEMKQQLYRLCRYVANFFARGTRKTHNYKLVGWEYRDLVSESYLMAYEVLEGMKSFENVASYLNWGLINKLNNKIYHLKHETQSNDGYEVEFKGMPEDTDFWQYLQNEHPEPIANRQEQLVKLLKEATTKLCLF